MCTVQERYVVRYDEILYDDLKKFIKCKGEIQD